VNRFSTRTSAVAAGLAACALTGAVVLTGCSAGQIAQTSTQEPAVNGTSATVGDITLRNVHLRAAQSADYVSPGRSVDLLFVAANQSPDRDEKLVGISSDIGTVTISGDTTVPAGGLLVVGTPDGQAAPLNDVARAHTAQATVALTKPISNGLTYNVTFAFERSGQTTVGVPISAGEAPRQEQQTDAVAQH
jgi:copper(I)-binding protein